MSTLPTLPADIQLLILDYIQLPSHLKALCLASKAWNDLARPLLYRKVTINVFDKYEVARFQRCMNAGAQTHLVATRSLTLMDSQPPPEAPEFQVQAHRHFYQEEKLRPVEISRIRAVIAYFPPNRLHTFRFLSILPFHAETAHDFFLRQAATLTHVHLRLDDFTPLKSLQCVRTADIWLPYVYGDWMNFDEENLMSFFSQIGAHKHMERLYIGTQFGQSARPACQRLSDSLAKAFSSRNNDCGHLESLRRLTLSGATLGEGLYQGISKVVPFSQLTHLTIWGSPHTLEFVSALVHGLGEQNLRLKHLGLDMYRNDATEEVELLLHRCTELRSLCLEWAHHDARSPEFLIRSLQVIGQNLVLLSLHHISLNHFDVVTGNYNSTADYTGDRFDVLKVECLEEICLACPNLEQFGYKISDKSLMTTYASGFYASLLPLCKLPKLRTLHLRQGFLYDDDDQLERVIRCDVEDLTRRFARNFFAYLEQQYSCPSLDTLVIGQERQARNGDDIKRSHDSRSVNKNECEPARCFRLRRATCEGETTRGTPHLISLAEFRATSNYAEILDWQSARDAFSDWMWRMPGRFNDD